MRPEIDQILRRAGGVTTPARLLTVVTRHQLDHEIRTGRLVAPYARSLCRPWDADLLLDRAALTSIGPPAALSHLSALRRWGIGELSERPIHVTVPARRAPRPRPGLVIHRAARFPPVVKLGGLITVAAAPAIASSWPLLPDRDRRAPAIDAVRRRLVTPDELRRAAGTAPRLTGRRELLALIELLEGGCESELEIWGHVQVFDAPGLRHGRRQPWVRANERRYRLDIGYLEERVAIEMDGHRFHSTRAQRERDMRRDADLATIDWLTLRFSHTRLHDDRLGVRRDVLATLAARKRTPAER